ncbi:MAG: MEKHLA domain-containing protein [Methylococcaceae bacterium]|nr:MEKHLA domain-containing protein [Methylococcaceae bacterium]
MRIFIEPSPENFFLERHVNIMRESLRHWSGRDLVDSELGNRNVAEYLYNAPFPLLSHDDGVDPVFNYANRSGQKMFGMNWSEFTRVHSRCSAEAANQEDRNRLLQEVRARGFIDQCQGIRISKSGRRFLFSNAIVWNLIGPDGKFYGQAAKFGQWEYLDEKDT